MFAQRRARIAPAGRKSEYLTAMDSKGVSDTWFIGAEAPEETVEIERVIAARSPWRILHRLNDLRTGGHSTGVMSIRVGQVDIHGLIVLSPGRRISRARVEHDDAVAQPHLRVGDAAIGARHLEHPSEAERPLEPRER